MNEKTRIGINGFGRIGRNVLRAALERDRPVEIVAVNDLSEAAVLAHLLTFDTVHGRLGHDISVEGRRLRVGTGAIELCSAQAPEQIPWSALGVDIVIESTGRFTGREDAARHLEGGARRVLVSAPAENADVTICMGVNHEEFDPDEHVVISNGSCTTNCLAPMVSVLHESFGVRAGFLTTVHAYTNDQNLLDLGHKDLRRSRAAAENITPSTTGAARAIGLVLPELAGRLDGLALRVPVPDGSITDLVCSLDRQPTREELNHAFSIAAAGRLRGILDYTELALVSSDVVGNSHSCLFSAVDTMVGPEHVKVLGWYDNEWGYANRLLDLAEFVAGGPGITVAA